MQQDIGGKCQLCQSHLYLVPLLGLSPLECHQYYVKTASFVESHQQQHVIDGQMDSSLKLNKIILAAKIISFHFRRGSMQH